MEMHKEALIESLKMHDFPKKILDAFRKVKRENFIPEDYKIHAYKNTALPIGHGQTISQPYTIALMLKLLELKNNQKILEIGSGSGYVLALINEIAKNSKIFGVERIKELAENSQRILENEKNIKIINKNGFNGLKEESPFDRILISASLNKIPAHIIAQLKAKGILVAPIKNSILKIKKSAKKNQIEESPGFAFVPFIENG